MWNLPSRQWIVAGACVLALLILIACATLFAPPYTEAASIGNGVRSFDELSERFSLLAEDKGAPYAFEVLRRASLRPGTDLHLLGHVVGDTLYKQQGVEGIASCTQDFRNACSHSVVIGTLQEFGSNAETLRLIDDACKKAPGGSGAYTMCYHGLGHGVFAFFGYDLAKTFAFCKRTGTAAYHEEQYTQCAGGAIMELMGGGGHDTSQWEAARVRYLTDNPRTPCSDSVVPEEIKGYCYVYLTPRLLELAGADLANPSPSTFPQAFSYCDAIPHSSQSQRDSCYGGFGKEFVPIAAARDIRKLDALDDATYATAAAWCLYTPMADGQRACIRQALESVFWGGESDPAASFRFCAASPDALRAPCYERLAQTIRQYLPGEDRDAWCGRLDETYRAHCSADAPIVYE